MSARRSSAAPRTGRARALPLTTRSARARFGDSLEDDGWLRTTLERVRGQCDIEARRNADPVGIVHSYADPHAQELVGLLASSMAFGQVGVLTAKIRDVLKRLAPFPQSLRSPAKVRRALVGFTHRVYTGEQIAGLLLGAARIQSLHGGLGRAFSARKSGELKEDLASFVDAVREAGNLRRTDRAAMHLLPDPRQGSASKRLLLYLRWMIRPADGIDLGLWDQSPARLVVPVDTHIHRLGRNLGWTDRATASWQTAEEITSVLRRVDPTDPVKYDFALCHLGMLQGCPSRQDPVGCDGCGVRPLCRHWRPVMRPPRRKPARPSPTR